MSENDTSNYSILYPQIGSGENMKEISVKMWELREVYDALRQAKNILFKDDETSAIRCIARAKEIVKNYIETDK